MSAVTSTNALAKDSTLQHVADAIETMSATSVGNMAALTTTDKSSLVGAVNELKSGLTNLIKVYHANSTTDSVGDFTFSVPSNGTLIYVRPLRDAEYYNSWWGVILASTGNNVGHSAKAIKDDNTALTSQAVKFDVYYI